MNLHLLRTSWSENSTTGQLYIDHDPECFTLEDEYRAIKVKGKTRIPEGRYKIELRKVDSPSTKKYRDRFTWFTYHLHLLDVPGFDFIYIHAGETDEHTDGCILVGDTVFNNRVKVDKYEHGALWHSSQAYERIYKKIAPVLRLDTEEVFIDITTYLI